MAEKKATQKKPAKKTAKKKPRLGEPFDVKPKGGKKGEVVPVIRVN